MTRRHYLINGRVQGVCYRLATAEVARKLNLAGWVRNLPDGKVEAVADGDEDNLSRLEEWLKAGPRLAEVSDVEIEEVEATETLGIHFETRR